VTRGRILEAAEHLFSDQGFANTSVEEIGQAAGGFSKGAVYSNFDNKTELLVAVFEAQYLRLTATLDEALGQVTEPGEQTAVVVAWYGEHFRNNPWPDSLPDLFAVARTDATARRRLRDHFRLIESTVTAMVKSEQARLGIRYELAPATIAALAVSIVAGLAITGLLEPERDNSELFAGALGVLLQSSPAAR